MGGSDGGGNLMDLQDTMLSKSAEEEKAIVEDCADQEADPAHTKVEHCHVPTVAPMDIVDTVLQSENATWSFLPSSHEGNTPAGEETLMNEEPTPRLASITLRTQAQTADHQIPISGKDELSDHVTNLASKEEMLATEHGNSDKTGLQDVQSKTLAGDEVKAGRREIEGTPDYSNISADACLTNDRQRTESRPSDQLMILGAVEVKAEDSIEEASLEPSDKPAVIKRPGQSHDAEGATVKHDAPDNHHELDKMTSKILETPPPTQSLTKKVHFKEESPKSSHKSKLAAETTVKSEHSVDVSWEDVAPKFEGNDCKLPPVKTQSVGPARTPREAVEREMSIHLHRRRQKQEKKGKQKPPQKRKADSSIEQHARKASRRPEDDNAAVVAHLMPAPGRDLSRVHGFDDPSNDHEAAEDENEQSCLNDDDKLGKDDVLDHDEEPHPEPEPEPEEANVLDFDLKRAITSANISSLKKIQKVFGHGRAIIDDTGGLMIENMVSPLWKEQARAVYWMMNQEEIPIGPRGGVLAAGMGTGKTVMSLGIIAGNPPLQDDLQTYSHATLVVVPNQKLARQWKEKIAEHCNAALAREALVFEPKKGRLPAYFQKRKIVVTTYYEIQRQKPPTAALQDLKQNWDNPKWRKALPHASRTSPLYYVNWYRIILDEAHKISNKETKTFKSCRALRAKYRWCLSGTPLANTDGEMFPYLSFLACDFAKSFKTFFERFKAEEEQKRKGNEGSRPHMDALMGLVLYRYKHVNGVTLGEAKDIHVPLSAEETIIFDNVKPIYGERPTILPRLRQTVSHAFNLDRMFGAEFYPAELHKLIKELKGLQNRRSVFEVLEQQSEDPASIQMFSAGLRKVQEILEERHEEKFQFEPLLQKIKEEQELRMERCTRCKKAPRSWKWVESYHCSHRFCSDCLPPPPRPVRNEECAHPECDAKVVFSGFVPTFATLTTAAMNSGGPVPVTDVNGSQVVKLNDDRPALLLSAFDYIPMPPSTKLVMAAAIILTWRIEHPEDKIVVFHEFLPSAQVLGGLLRQAGERFLYIFGNTGETKTQIALKRFRSNDMSTPILLAGIHTVGEGLNLTEANRVITIDLWWNNAKEDQAFARVHRIGQTKPTYFVRIVSQGDKRITAIQDRKAKEVSYAMKEDGHKVKKLGKNAYNALFKEDTNSTNDDESEDENEDQDEEDDDNDGNDDGKFGRSCDEEAQGLTEIGSIAPADSAEEHGVELNGLEVHSTEDCDMAGDDNDVQGVVQGTNGDEMSDVIDNGYGDQSQVLLPTGS